jgi:hypothetical protein
MKQATNAAGAKSSNPDVGNILQGITGGVTGSQQK